MANTFQEASWLMVRDCLAKIIRKVDDARMSTSTGVQKILSCKELAQTEVESLVDAGHVLVSSARLTTKASCNTSWQS